MTASESDGAMVRHASPMNAESGTSVCGKSGLEMPKRSAPSTLRNVVCEMSEVAFR